jgi:hypothetical protein
MLFLGVIARPAQAATSKEAIKCGVAFFTMTSKAEALIYKGAAKVCKRPGDLATIAAKVTLAINRVITKVNLKFSGANCDPDIASGFPVQFFSVALVSAELDLFSSFCDNIDGAPF